MKKYTLLALSFVLVLSMLISTMVIAAPSATGATIVSDLADYNPGGTVTLTGSGWAAAESVHIYVNDDVGSTWSLNSSPDPVADDSGGFTYVFTLPNWFVASYSVTATGGASGTATTSFTDANASANLDQCANDPVPSPSSDGCSASASDWVNGNLGASKAVYFEGDSIPYRLRFGSLSLNSHTVTIEWDTTKSSTHAIDYLTSFDRTVATANPCLGISGCGASTTFPIPVDPQLTTAGVTPAAGAFRMYGGTITNVSAYSYANGTGFTGDKSARISITFTASTSNPVLAWGGHISSRADWGMNNSAVTISGSPYHTRLIALDGSGGNQDRSLSADAVIFPGSITIVKNANPQGSTSFPFSASPLPLGSFALVDDGTTANTNVFGNITSFQTYTVTENVPSGWDLTGLTCSVTSPNGGSQSVSLSTATVTINLAEGENVTCTYGDKQQPATLIVKKLVINDNGGSAIATDFQFSVNSGAATSFTQDGADPLKGANSLTVPPGVYSVTEPPAAGYTTTYDNCSNLNIPAGGSATCTITNDDQQAYVIVNKVVVNDNGGTAKPDDFSLTLGGNPTLSGVKVAVNPGTYTAGETQLSGYTFTGFSGDCNSSGSVTVALGETKTCTLTNDDQQAYVVVNKIVINDNGGSAKPDDFNLTLDGNPTLSGAKVAVNPGTYTAGETQLPGYTFTGFTGDCTTNGAVTVALGQTKTCTLTNDDQQAYVIVNKVVVNDNGGSAQPDDFKLTLDGKSTLNGVKVAVNPGSHTAAETQLYGYSFSGFSGDCDTNGAVSVALGETKSCTLTNDDQPGTIIIKKITKPVNTGSFAFTTSGTGYNGFTLPGGGQNSQTLNAGTYTVKESTQLGWILTGIGGSTDPNTPYNCVVTGTGGSSGVGDLNTQTATINLKIGDTVTCVFENTGQGVTRTQGFWATHSPLANAAWFGGPAFGHTFPGVASIPGIGDTNICGRPVDTLGKLMGGFWSDISKLSTGAKRASLDQARMQLLQQLLAAELNASAFGSVPSGGMAKFAAWESALCGSNATTIKNAMQEAAAFNTQGDNSTFTPGTSADSKYARSIANIPFWDIIKP